MAIVFYFLVATLLFIEVCNMSCAKQINKKLNDIRAYKKEHGKTPEKVSKNILLYSFAQFYYMAIVIIGFMSSQWAVFVTIFILAFIPKRWLWFRYVDSAIGIILLMFALLNKYHFHIDLLELILQ